MAVHIYTRQVVYRFRMRVGSTSNYVYKDITCDRPITQSLTPITRPAVTVSYGGSTSTTGVFNAGWYNVVEKTCESVGKPTRWMYYTNSDLTTEISGLNKIYWREEGDTDSSKWGGYNAGSGIYVNTWYYPNSYWNSSDFSSYTFPASSSISLTAYKPSSGYSECGSYYVVGNKFSRTVYVTFPDKATYQRVTGSSANLTGWKCRTKSYAYGGNTYGAGQKVTVGSPGNYYFYPVISASNKIGQVVLNPMGGVNDLHDMTDGGSIWLKHGTAWCWSQAGNTTISSINKPTRDGYIFEGYYTEASGGNMMIDNLGDIQASVTFTEDDYEPLSKIATWYAHWTPIEYTLTARVNNSAANEGSMAISSGWKVVDNAIGTKTVKCGEKFGDLPYIGYNTTKFSYKWYDASGNVVTKDTTMGAGDTTIYCRWTKLGTTVKLNTNSGSDTISGMSWTEKDLKFGDALGDLPTPTRSGYTFLGWYTRSEGGTKKISTDTVPTNASDPYILYAHWSQGSIITFDCNGGNYNGNNTFVKSNVKLNDTAIGIMTSNKPVKTGCIFAGWFTRKSNGTKIYSYNDDGTITAVKNTTYFSNDSPPKWKYTGNVTFYAQWITANCWAYNSGWQPIRNIWVYNNGWKKVSNWWAYNGGFKPKKS